MSVISIGYADGGGAPLQPPRSPPARQKVGTFTVDLGPTLSLKLRDDLPKGLMLGLLTQAPFPEGNGFEELIAEGYARQPLGFERQRVRDTSNTAVTFGPVTPDWPNATHAAIFNEDGALLYYGAIHPLSIGGATAQWVEFGVGAISVKRANRPF